MKNGKRIAALLGVVALLIIFCLPMFFALKGDFSQGAFMASLYTVLFVAVMGYVIWMVFRLVNKKKNEDKSSVHNIYSSCFRLLSDYCLIITADVFS